MSSTEGSCESFSVSEQGKTHGALIQSDTLPRHLYLKYRSPDRQDSVETEFYILGTAHVSKTSCEEAARLIQEVKPDIVMLELCIERQPILSVEKLRQISLLEVLEEIHSGKATPFQAFYSWLLGKVGQDLEVIPGEEFRVATREAKEVGAAIVLGDRPLNITAARLWASLSRWAKFKITMSLLWTGVASSLKTEDLRSEVERLKDSDVFTEAIKEFESYYPGISKPLITERDLYMTHILRRIAGSADTVVGVVGAGHLEGIRAHWDAEIDVAALLEMPSGHTLRRGKVRLNWGTTLLLTGGSIALATLLIVRLRR